MSASKDPPLCNCGIRGKKGAPNMITIIPYGNYYWVGGPPQREYRNYDGISSLRCVLAPGSLSALLLGGSSRFRKQVCNGDDWGYHAVNRSYVKTYEVILTLQVGHSNFFTATQENRNLPLHSLALPMTTARQINPPKERALLVGCKNHWGGCYADFSANIQAGQMI